MTRAGKDSGSAVLKLLGGALVAASLIAAGCNPGHDTFMLLPMSVWYQADGNLLTAMGDMLPTTDANCAGQDDGTEPAGAGARQLLIDTATPLSAFVPAQSQPPLSFRHGEVALFARQPNSNAVGPMRVLLCDVPLVRADQDLGQFRLDYDQYSTGPLGGVVGGDLLGRFAMTVRWQGPDAQLTFTRSNIAPSCQLDDTVLPFRPLGGQLAVEVGDSVITYPATRITVSACVEPLADPLRPGGERVCLPSDGVSRAITGLGQQRQDALNHSPVDQTRVDQLQRWIDALNQLSSPQCTAIPDSIATDLGDAIDDQSLLDPSFMPSGVDMQFLVSTAVPELIISQTACQRLADPARCSCADADKKKLRLPGLNPTDDAAEQGCPIKLGGSTRSGLSLVARQRYLSACGELARSRRQRYGLPNVVPPPSNEVCGRQACLVNLQRGSPSNGRCAYSGPDPQYACDDHTSPVAPVVELGGPPDGDGPATAPDQVDALVVPDTARILQSVNGDIRSDGAQVDGVIGVGLLTRLATTIDYPQTRVAVSCRCADKAGHVCRAYRGVTYNSADSCSQDSALLVPSNYSRSFCR